MHLTVHASALDKTVDFPASYAREFGEAQLCLLQSLDLLLLFDFFSAYPSHLRSGVLVAPLFSFHVKQGSMVLTLLSSEASSSDDRDRFHRQRAHDRADLDGCRDRADHRVWLAEETMKKVLLLFCSIVLLLPSSEAFARKHYVDPVFGVKKHHRTHVVIHKRPVCNTPGCDGGRPVQPIVIPVAAIPPLAIFYDLARRTDCRGDVLGLGGPGFSSPITPATGNVMTTAYMRGECTPTPRYRRVARPRY